MNETLKPGDVIDVEVNDRIGPHSFSNDGKLRKATVVCLPTYTYIGRSNADGLAPGTYQNRSCLIVQLEDGRVGMSSAKAAWEDLHTLVGYPNDWPARIDESGPKLSEHPIYECGHDHGEYDDMPFFANHLAPDLAPYSSTFPLGRPKAGDRTGDLPETPFREGDLVRPRLLGGLRAWLYARLFVRVTGASCIQRVLYDTDGHHRYMVYGKNHMGAERGLDAYEDALANTMVCEARNLELVQRGPHW